MTSEDNFFIIPPSAKVVAPTTPGRKKWYQRWWGKVIIVFVILFLVMSVAMAFYVIRVSTLLRSGVLTPDELFGSTGQSSSSGNLPTQTTTDDPSLGNPKSKVVIVEFSDFQCPFCQQAQPVIKQLLKDYGDKIFFVYRDFPLESVHPQAVIGALAGECAHEQGKFWEYHDKVFANQEQLSVDNLKIWAVQLGLNSLQFSDCLDSAKYFDEVNKDLQDGIAAGVTATPTFFIDGHKVEGALPLATFEQIVLSELNGQ